jgi:hypothetical protein
MSSALPKIQTAEEAALWNEMLTALEAFLGLDEGTIKVYVLVEQLEATFQLMEIRAALGRHFVGYNTGRWDYINSVADANAWDPAFLNPNIESIVMTYGYMRNYEDRVRRAVNTPDAVIVCGGRYYCCDEAVWFVSGAPDGPWAVCVDVPAAIYTIPPSCPLYNVTYVRVYDYTPTLVYTGYLPGYTCSYVYGGTVVYGTGYYYRPWYRRHYYPRYATWGWGVTWNPYSGWGFSFGVRYGGPVTSPAA